MLFLYITFKPNRYSVSAVRGTPIHSEGIFRPTGDATTNLTDYSDVDIFRMSIYFGVDVLILRCCCGAGMAQDLLDHSEILGFPVDQVPARMPQCVATHPFLLHPNAGEVFINDPIQADP